MFPEHQMLHSSYLTCLLRKVPTRQLSTYWTMNGELDGVVRCFLSLQCNHTHAIYQYLIYITCIITCTNYTFMPHSCILHLYIALSSALSLTLFPFLDRLLGHDPCCVEGGVEANILGEGNFPGIWLLQYPLHRDLNTVTDKLDCFNLNLRFDVVRV